MSRGNVLPDQTCDDGLYCLSNSCQPLPGPGTSCAQSRACAEGAYCDPGTQSGTSDDVCAAQKAAGATCTGTVTRECATGTCDPVSKTCLTACNSTDLTKIPPSGCTQVRILTQYLLLATLFLFLLHKRRRS